MSSRDAADERVADQLFDELFAREWALRQLRADGDDEAILTARVRAAVERLLPAFSCEDRGARWKLTCVLFPLGPPVATDPWWSTPLGQQLSRPPSPARAHENASRSELAVA